MEYTFGAAPAFTYPAFLPLSSSRTAQGSNGLSGSGSASNATGRFSNVLRFLREPIIGVYAALQ